MRINEPYNAHLFEGQCENSLTRFGNKSGEEFDFNFKNHPGLGLIEFRNDLLKDEKIFEKLVKDFSEALECLIMNEEKFICCNYQVEICDQVKLKENVETENCLINIYENKRRIHPKIAFFAPYASGNLPEGYEWPEEDIRNLVEHDHHYDVKTLDLAESLAQHFSVVSVSPKYSRILVDPTKIFTNLKKIPQEIPTLEKEECGIKNIPIMLNKNITEEEFQKRIKAYELGFQEGLILLSNEKNIKPDYWISLRTFKQANCKNLERKKDLILS